MPTIRTLPDLEWGDMLVADRGIFSVDSTGHLKLIFGHPIKVNTDVPEYRNEDGSDDRCTEIAFEYLGLDTRPVVQCKKEHSIKYCPTELLNALLSSYPVESWDGSTGDFILTHPQGSYFIFSAPEHASALIDGIVKNIKFSTMPQKVIQVWKIR